MASIVESPVGGGGMGVLSREGVPPLLPARKYSVINDLRGVVVCKIFITKGLCPNSSISIS
jgi:hypothetical protein